MNSSRSSRSLAVLVSMVLLGVGLPVLGVAAGAQAAPVADPSPLWTPAARPQARASSSRATVDPSAAEAYTLRSSAMDSRLSGSSTVTVPSPEGKLVEFSVHEDSVMQAGLQAAHPGLRSYTGSAVGHPGTSIRMDVGALGFHASVRDGGGLGAWYVDPAFVGEQSLYLSYLGTSLPPREQPTEANLDLSALPSGKAAQATTRARSAETAARPGTAARRAADPDAGTSVIQRTYRLALLNDPTYAAYFDKSCTASSDACVLSAKQTLVSRLDQIYGTDLAIKMVLINATDKLNLDTTAKATGHDSACGPAVCYTPSQLSQCSSDTLYRTRTTLGALVGAGSYDIGHLALGTSGGGLSFVGAVGTFIKGGGCTGIDPPTGDRYAVDFVAHEMGHQFGANHTFESDSEGSCSGTRNQDTSVEPGSGSSIMAYAGICDRSDLQPHSDPQFSQISQSQIHDYVSRQYSTDPADGDNEDEAQTVSLSDFGSGDSFRLTYASRTTAPITYAAYSTSPTRAVEDALDAILPDDGRVDVYPYGSATSYTNGFEVDFTSANLRGRDLPQMSVSVTGGTGSVAETDQGGPVDNQGAAVTTANHNPTVSAPAAKTIPTRTPFTLEGSGADPDNDPLSYLWEQNDIGGIDGTPLLSQAKKRGPLFRIFGDIAHVERVGQHAVRLGGGAPSGHQPFAHVPRPDPGARGQHQRRHRQLPGAARLRHRVRRDHRLLLRVAAHRGLRRLRRQRLPAQPALPADGPRRPRRCRRRHGVRRHHAHRRLLDGPVPGHLAAGRQLGPRRRRRHRDLAGQRHPGAGLDGPDRAVHRWWCDLAAAGEQHRQRRQRRGDLARRREHQQRPDPGLRQRQLLLRRQRRRLRHRRPP